mgnify:CR=1 FL=1
MTRAELKYYISLHQKKYRDKENKFLIEGIHLIEEILKSKFYSNNLETVFVSGEFDDKDLLSKLAKNNIPFEIINNKEIEKLSETKTPQGIVGVVNKITSSKPKGSSLIVALDMINDPGNIGTIIRTCYWFNVDELILSKGSADIFNSKVIRSSQGAVFNLSITTGIDLVDYLNKQHRNGFKVYLTTLNTSQTTTETVFTGNDKFIFVFGNESTGISKSILENPDFHSIKIPPYSECESLNVGISVGIILNEFRNKSK